MNPYIEDLVNQFWRQAPKCSTFADLIGPPGLLLARDISGADNTVMRVDQEQGKDLAMAGLGRVGKAEFRDTVLKDLFASKRTS